MVKHWLSVKFWWDMLECTGSNGPSPGSPIFNMFNGSSAVRT